MNKEFCEYIDKLINQIDKRQNSFNADDMRFIAFKGKQQTIKNELEFWNNLKNKSISNNNLIKELNKRLEEIVKELIGIKE